MTIEGGMQRGEEDPFACTSEVYLDAGAQAFLDVRLVAWVDRPSPCQMREIGSRASVCGRILPVIVSMDALWSITWESRDQRHPKSCACTPVRAALAAGASASAASAGAPFASGPVTLNVLFHSVKTTVGQVTPGWQPQSVASPPC